MHDTASSEFRLALDYFQQGEIETARDISLGILQKNPQHSNTLNLMGVISWKQGELETAITLIEEAMRNHPEKSPIFAYNLAMIHTELGNISYAATIYKKTAEAFLQRNDTEEALNCLQQGAFLLRDCGAPENAKEFYHKILLIDPSNIVAINDLGLIFQQENKLEDAIACYKKVIQLDPLFATAYNNLGTAFQLQNKSDEACVLFEKALDCDSHCLEAYVNLGNHYRVEEWYEKAIEYYQKALELVPEHPRVHNYLGLIFHDQGELQKAVDHFRIAIQSDPTYLDAEKNLSEALQDENLAFS